jgi:hypothetical protein
MAATNYDSGQRVAGIPSARPKTNWLIHIVKPFPDQAPIESLVFSAESFLGASL